MGGEHRQADPAVVARRHGLDERGERHLRDVELGELELAPEHLGRVQGRSDEIDAVGLDRAVENRCGARIDAHGDAELKLHLGLQGLDSRNSVGLQAALAAS